MTNSVVPNAWANPNFGWGWSNDIVGWGYNTPSPQTPSGMGGDSSPPVMMDEQGVTTRQRNSTANSLVENATITPNNFSSNSTAVNSLSDAVAKFRRIVTQIREITRRELGS